MAYLVYTNQNINTDVYLELLQNEFVPHLEGAGLINDAFFMQDEYLAIASFQTGKILYTYFNVK